MIKIILLFLISGLIYSHADTFSEAKTAYQKGDYTKSISLYNKACNENDLRSCINLGNMYTAGNGTQKDYSKAFTMYKKACDKNEPLGCSNLGTLYEDGNGIAQNKITASQLYEKGCLLSYAPACGNLALLYLNGSGVAQNKNKAKAYFQKACNLGDVEACNSEKVTMKEYDQQGREIIHGPIKADMPFYRNIHVISNSYGIITKGAVEISNVVIEAPVCIQSSGYGLHLSNSDLYCELGVEFTENFLMNNQFYNNRYSGRLSNRPDSF